MIEENHRVADKVDFCITYFKRQQGLIRLLESINRYYPEADITIAAQGEDIDIPGCTVFRLPEDYGLSASRNYLVKNTTKPYVLILEDDFIFKNATDIKLMVELLESDKYVGVVGGVVEEHGQEIHFEHFPHKKERILEHIPDGDDYYKYRGITYKQTGCVLNFALFKREVFDSVMWDNQLKLCDHNDFYLRLKQTPWTILYTPQVVIDTKKDYDTREYKQYKQRDDFKKIFFDKHGLDKIVYLDGYEIKYDREKDKIIKGKNL